MKVAYFFRKLNALAMRTEGIMNVGTFEGRILCQTGSDALVMLQMTAYLLVIANCGRDGVENRDRYITG